MVRQRYFPVLWALVAAILTTPAPVGAETRTVSWSAVTTYTDGTPFAAGTIVTYNFFWTSDPSLSAASLGTIASSVPQTSATFDPDEKGMPRGQAVYFTGEVLLGTGEKSGLSPAYSWTVPIVTTNPTLSSLSVSGPSSVNESGSGTYSATAAWSDGSTTSVTPTWGVSPTTYASIGTGGVLTTLAVSSNQTATVTATYTSGGVTKTASFAVTIVDVPPGTLAAMQNLAVTGPVATSPARLFRLSWDAVTGFADGTPIPAGTVRYTAYWTTDADLSASTLKVVASSITETSMTFDPVAQGMEEGVRVYFTTVATAPSGAMSPLSAGVSWVASNIGPAPPSGGIIIKR